MSKLQLKNDIICQKHTDINDIVIKAKKVEVLVYGPTDETDDWLKIEPMAFCKDYEVMYEVTNNNGLLKIVIESDCDKTEDNYPMVSIDLPKAQELYDLSIEASLFDINVSSEAVKSISAKKVSKIW